MFVIRAAVVVESAVVLVEWAVVAIMSTLQ